MFLVFQTSPITLHHSPDCHIDRLANRRRLPVDADVARFHGLGNGIGCIIRQVLIHTCCKALIEKKVEVSMGNWEQSFTISGFFQLERRNQSIHMYSLTNK